LTISANRSYNRNNQSGPDVLLSNGAVVMIVAEYALAMIISA
jgi:hypothetical protein